MPRTELTDEECRKVVEANAKMNEVGARLFDTPEPSLRDQFAMAALTGYVAALGKSAFYAEAERKALEAGLRFKDAAAMAMFQWADAMLRARQSSSEGE